MGGDAAAAVMLPSWRDGWDTPSSASRDRPFDLLLSLFGYRCWSHPVVSASHGHVNNHAACTVLTELPPLRATALPVCSLLFP